MSDTLADMRAVGFGRNTLFKRHGLQCRSLELGFSSIVGESFKAALVFFWSVAFLLSALKTHKSSY